MSHVRIEEVSDSDPEIDDPTDFIAPVNLPPPNARNNVAFRPSPPPSSSSSSSIPNLQPLRPSAPAPSRETLKPFIALYPLYFDSSRSHASGRRVPSHLAISSPLAYDLLPAIQSACHPHPLPFAFEPDKLHPRDWSNPGRVRIQLRNPATGALLHPTIKNKKHLMLLVGRYLQSHPTDEKSPLKLKIQGLPVPEEVSRPAVPRGWKVNGILPLHSPAVSGGGVSDDFLGDVMKGMGGEGGGEQGGMPAGMAQMMQAIGGGAGGGGGQKEIAQGKKEKKGKKDKKKGKA